MQSKKVFFIIGALLVAGLFLIQLKSRTPVSDTTLKPSQIDFINGNQILTEAKSAVAAEAKTSAQLPKQTKLSKEDQQKWQAFSEIVHTKNDNDPRTDQLLKDLSPEMHQSLIQTYQTLPKENRNGRGLIAFLISRDLKTAQDANFLKEIYQESPCLSMQDCSKEAASDLHHDGANQTSLNYPQLASLYQIEKKLEGHPELLMDSELKSGISDMLRDARQYPVPPVQKRAEAIQQKFGL